MIGEHVKKTIAALVDQRGFDLEKFPSPNPDFDFYLYKPISNGVLAVTFIHAGEEEAQLLALERHLANQGTPAYVVQVLYGDATYVRPLRNIPNYASALVDEGGTYVDMDEGARRVLLAPPAPRQRANLLHNPVTLTLIFLNILMFLFTAALSGSTNIHILVLVRFGAKVNELVAQGEVWRLLTSAFLHGNLMHIFFNMYALMNLGQVVEATLGKVRFLVLYFLSALGGGLMSYLFTPNPSVGASGAVFGLLGAVLILGLTGRSPHLKRALPNILFIIGINLFIGFAGSSVIDNWGHIGGLLMGLVATAMLLPFPGKRTP